MTKERRYLIGEEQLRNWRNRLSTAYRYPEEQEGTKKALNAVLASIDSVLASGNYHEE